MPGITLGRTLDEDRQEYGNHDPDDADRGVLTIEIRCRALLDGLRDALHPLGAVGLPHNPDDQSYAIENGGQCPDERQGQYSVVVHRLPQLRCSFDRCCPRP